MIGTNQFKSGIAIEIDSKIFTILEFQHIKPGKGQAFVRTRLRNVETGQVLDRTFRAGEKVNDVYMEEKKYQYLYASNGRYHFMDHDSYEETEIDESLIGDSKNFLKENMEISILLANNKMVGVNLPNFVEFAIVGTEPGFKGDTVKGAASKPAKIETGATIQVPLFIETGEIIKIDTRTGKYVERVKK